MYINNPIIKMTGKERVNIKKFTQKTLKLNTGIADKNFHYTPEKQPACNV